MQNTKHRKIEKPRANDWRETIHDSQSMCCKHSHTTPPPTTEEEKTNDLYLRNSSERASSSSSLILPSEAEFTRPAKWQQGDSTVAAPSAKASSEDASIPDAISSIS